MKLCRPMKFLLVLLLIGSVSMRAAAADGEMAAAVGNSDQPEVYDVTFCQLHYEKMAARDRANEALVAHNNCTENCDAEADRYQLAYEASLAADQRYYDYYEAHWRSRSGAETDQFWDWCLGLGGPPEVQGAPIVLKASLEGGGEDTQTVDNSQNLGTIDISGVVRDVNTGNGIGGVVVQILSGANPVSTITNNDGYYSFQAIVPDGQESGELTGLDFELVWIPTLNISLQAGQAELPADGTSTTPITLLVTGPDGNPLPGLSFDLTLKGDDGQGSIQPAQGTTDENGLLMATYTAFKPQAGSSFADNEHQVTITATDRDTGESTILDLLVNQNLIAVVGNQILPACSRCNFPAEVDFDVRDARGSPIPNAPVVVRLEGANGDQGTLVTSPESTEKNTELHLQTGQDGRARLYYKWLGGADIVEAVQNIHILEEETNSLIIREITIHGLDLAIAKVEEAGFTGVTNQQAFLKIYFKDRIHPDLDLGRFNRDSANRVRVRVTIRQFESEGAATSLPFEDTAGWDTDEGGLYVKMPATPHIGFIIPVNDGTTWYEVRLDPVDDDDIPLADLFRGNNDTIIALKTGSPDGWLHIWLSDGILTPHSYTGVFIKCVARFLPGLGDAITVIDALNQIYNTDVLGLGQSTAQVLTEELQRRVGQTSPSLLTKAKASILNNIVSCIQDGYGVYKQTNQEGSSSDCGRCSTFASLAPLALPVPVPSRVSAPDEINQQAVRNHIDQFIHGLLMDTPDQRAIVVSGLPAESVAILDAEGQLLDDPDLMSAGGGVAVYILPADNTYTLQVTAGSPFDVGVYQVGDSDEARKTHRHSLQPVSQVAASMYIGGASDYALTLDQDGDGAPDHTLQATVIVHDVVRPTITGTRPAQESTLSESTVTIQAEFADNPGGSGIDPQAIKIFVDGVDLTSSADVQPDSLSLTLSDFGTGEHTARLVVNDLYGNATAAEWTFSVQQGSSFSLNTTTLLLVAGGGALFLMGVVLVIGGVVFFSRRSQRSKSGQVRSQAPEHIQDDQGRSWYQDRNTGGWYLWNGQEWQLVPGAAPDIAAPQRAPANKQRSRWSLPLSLIVSVIIGLIVFGGISLVAFNFFPDYQLELGDGDLGQVLKMGGGGLLVTILGLLLLNGGFKAIISRRAIVEDEWGRRREKRGCSAILNGLGQLTFGVLCLAGGVGLMTLALYQEILPWLGF